MNTHRLLVEQLDSHGNAVSREILTLDAYQESVTVGRSVESDVVLNDEYAAPHHATITIADDGSLTAIDHDTINGLVVAGKRHHSDAPIALEDNTLRIGRSHLRLRSSRAALPPERSDRAAWFMHPLFLSIVGGVATFAHTGFEAWVEAPKDVTAAVLLALSAMAAVAAIWVAVFALLSRIIRSEWRWLRHTAIFLVVAAISALLGEAMGLAWFALELPASSAAENWFLAFVITVLLYLHLRQVADLGRRRAFLFAAMIPVLTMAGMAWMSTRHSAQDVNAIDAEIRIYPPSMRVTHSVSLETFLADAAKLRKQAVKKRDALPSNDNTPQGLFGF